MTKVLQKRWHGREAFDEFSVRKLIVPNKKRTSVE